MLILDFLSKFENLLIAQHKYHMTFILRSWGGILAKILKFDKK